MALLPDVENVTLSHGPLDENVIRNLTFNKTGTFLTPKMKTMILRNITVQKEWSRAFVDMVQSRLRILGNVDGLGRGMESLFIKTFYPDEPLLESQTYKLLRQKLSPEEMASVTDEVIMREPELP